MSAPRVLLLAASFATAGASTAGAVEIGAIAGYPQCRISIEHEGDGWQKMQLAWGTKDPLTGKAGPRLRLTTDNEPTDAGTVELDTPARDEVFRAVQELADEFGLAPSFAEPPESGEYLALTIGGDFDPVVLVYQKAHPARWNSAQTLWMLLRSKFDTRGQTGVPKLDPVPVPEEEEPPKPGMGPIVNYLQLEVALIRYTGDGKKTEYLNFEWDRNAAGEIDFGAEWRARGGRATKSEPDPRHIKILYEHLNKLTSSYRLPPGSMFKMDDFGLTGRGYNGLVLNIENGGPGINSWMFYEEDRIQWAAAMRFWKSCRLLFPEDAREAIAEDR